MAKHIRTPFDETLPSPVYFRTDTLQPDSAYPRHRHRWGEFVYAFTGVMELRLGDRQYLAPPQYGIWVPPGVEHVGLNRHEATFCSLYLARERCRRLPRDACAVAVGPLLKALLEQLRARRIDTARTPQEVRLVDVVIDELAGAPRHGSYLPSSEDPLLRPVLAAVEARPEDSRSLSEWAERVHTTERTLVRRCQRDLGMSFGEWRQRLRVVRALSLLEAGRSVESIALDLGYGSSSAFIAMFRRRTGTSPAELRRQAAGEAPRTPSRRHSGAVVRRRTRPQ